MIALAAAAVTPTHFDPLELFLHALLRIEAERCELQLHESHRRHPGLEAIDRFGGQAESFGFFLEFLEAGLAERFAQRAVLGIHPVLQHPGLRLQRVEVVHVDFHDQRRGVCIRAIECGRQLRICRAQQMHGASEVDGISSAANRPDGRFSQGVQAAEQTDEDDEPAAEPALESTHTTSVTSVPSGRSSSVRYAGGRESTAKSSARGRNCAQVEGVASRRTFLRRPSNAW